LASPDLLFGFDADPAIRNVIGVAAKFPELAVQAIKMRAYGQEVIRHTSGKRIHGTGAVPGGVNKNISIEERDIMLKDLPQQIEWAEASVKIAKDYTLDNLEMLAPFGSFDSNHGAILTADGTLDLYDGNFNVIDAEGNPVLVNKSPDDYLEYLQEEVRPWSYMKFPFVKHLGPEKGWYRVGPLPRINACKRIDTPKAEAARKDFMNAVGNKTCNITMAYHWTRMIENLHAIEKIDELLHDPDLQGTDLVVKGDRAEKAVSVLEAPRGTLWHNYEVDENDQVTMANLIVSTTQNNEPMNQSVQRVAQDHISGQPEITEGMLNSIEVAIRAYDPCLSCATHALGQMPLSVELFDAEGKLVQEKRKN
jgi:NAD-reducing hydrogenase large subunit